MNNLKPFTDFQNKKEFKMEIKLNIKALGRADINFEFSCNAEEAMVLINDPVYQNLGAALVDHIKLENEQLRNQQSDRFEHLRKTYEADRKAQNNHNKAVIAGLRSLQEQVFKMLDRINRNKF